MRLVAFAVLLTLAMPAVAQELGQRTRSPETMVPGLAPGQDDLAEAIAAAATHPLGTRENPVRVGGPEGERAYIARLRCANGEAPRVGERSAAGVGAFGTVVNAWALDCGSAAPGRTSLVMDMYHEEHVEERAPPGFTIVAR